MLQKNDKQIFLPLALLNVWFLPNYHTVYMLIAKNIVTQADYNCYYYYTKLKKRELR